LPVFTITKDIDKFEVSIQEPLQPAGADWDDESVATAYAKRLEPFAMAEMKTPRRRDGEFI
jgi:hypothetical protein